MPPNKKVRRENISWLENDTHYINCAVFIDRAVPRVTGCVFEHCSFRDESLMIHSIDNCAFVCCNFHILTSNFYEVTFNKCHLIEVNTNYLTKNTLQDCNIKRIMLHGGKVDVEALASVRGLLALSLENMQVENIGALFVVDELQSLDLRGVESHVFCDVFTKMQFSQLRELNLSNTRCTNRDIEFLEAYSSLQILNLGQTQITNRGLQHLQNLHNLHSLFLNHTAIQNLSNLSTLENLKFLNLSHSDFEDHSNLQRFCALTHLDLTEIAINRYLIDYIRKLPNLKWLAISRGNISVDFLREHLPHLPYISVASYWGRHSGVYHLWNS